MRVKKNKFLLFLQIFNNIIIVNTNIKWKRWTYVKIKLGREWITKKIIILIIKWINGIKKKKFGIRKINERTIKKCKVIKGRGSKHKYYIIYKYNDKFNK
jgi:hypothetical protein